MSPFSFPVDRLVPCDVLRYDEIDPQRKRLVGLAYRQDAHIESMLPAFEAFVHEQPVIQNYLRTWDGRATKISDFASKAEWHRSGMYNEFFRQIGLEEQMAFILPAPRPLVIGLAFNRDRRSFSERDRAVLNLLRPHVVQAYRNAEAVTALKAEPAWTRGALEAMPGGVIALSPAGRIMACSRQARVWLEEAFPSWRRRPSSLPAGMLDWFRRNAADARGPVNTTDAMTSGRRPLRIERAIGGALVARLLTAGPAGGWVVVLEAAEAEACRDEWEHDAAVADLPPRVRRVLRRVLAGDSEKEAAQALRLSRNTVHEYMKIAYRQLGVCTRTELLARLLHSGRSR